MTRTGGGEPSREAKRTAGPDSSWATRIHPKLDAGAFTHACTSAAMADEVKTAVPDPPLTDWDALAVGAKSPPGVLQFAVPKIRAFQVASPGVAAAPPPPPISAAEVPSPQSASTR